jgi:8-oxo-dGTP pyrophosphatase MutT (NUDIX family)
VSAIENGRIIPIARIDARMEPYDWRFASEMADEIATHWTKLTVGKPSMFNGRVMLQHRAQLVGDVFEAGYFETDYASFLGWRDFGWPHDTIRNGFAMGALRAADGAFLCGRMGAHTANAGMVYFAAGTPDRSDLRPDGTLDLAGSVTRELCEETGLTEDDIVVTPEWHAVVTEKRVAFMRPVSIALPAVEARALILDRIGRQEEPELDDIVIIRSVADCAAYSMAPFMPLFLGTMFDKS